MTRTYLIILAVFMFALTAGGQEAAPEVDGPAVARAEGVLEVPTAKIAEVDNLVPPQMIRQLAHHTARQQWGRTILINEIPCCDADGNVTAYMMVYQIGGDRARPGADILSEVRQGRQNYQQAVENLERYRPLLEQEFRKSRRVKNEEKIAAVQQAETPVTETDENGMPKPVTFDPPEQYRRAYEEFDAARKQKWGTGRYGYLLVSARFDQNPVRVRGNGLPYFYSQSDLIQERAQETLKSRPTLKRIFMKTPLDQWYEFEGEDGATALVNPFTKETHETSELPTLMTPATREAPPIEAAAAAEPTTGAAQTQDDARAEYFGQKWQRLLAEAEGGEQQ